MTQINLDRLALEYGRMWLRALAAEEAAKAAEQKREGDPATEEGGVSDP